MRAGSGGRNKYNGLESERGLRAHDEVTGKGKVMVEDVVERMERTLSLLCLHGRIANCFLMSSVNLSDIVAKQCDSQ